MSNPNVDKYVWNVECTNFDGESWSEGLYDSLEEAEKLCKNLLVEFSDTATVVRIRKFKLLGEPIV